MKKISLLCLLICLMSSLIRSQTTYYTAHSGTWNDNTAWSTVAIGGTSCSCSPGCASLAAAVYIGNSMTSSNCLSGIGANAVITIEAGDTLTVTVTTKLLVNNSTINILSGGVMIVNGEMDLAVGDTINNAGTLTINGNVSDTGTGAYFAGNGVFGATGTVTGTTVFVNPQGLWQPVSDTNTSDTGKTSIVYTGGNVGIGTTNPTKTLQVQGSAIISDTLNVAAVQAHRIALFPGDSLIRFGDSSIVMNMNTNNIYSTGERYISICCPPQILRQAYYEGIALGSNNNVTGENFNNTTSIAVGTNNKLNNGALSIGWSNTASLSSISIGYLLTNTIPGSIMMGGSGSTNHTPAISIIPANGGPGYVGIGTTATNLPICPFDVNGTGTPNAGMVAHFSNSTSSVFLTTLTPNPADWSPLTQPNDNGIFWDDASGGGNRNSGFVIAPHNGPGGIRIDASGYVGIGTASPDAMLDIYPANANIQLPFSIQSRDAPYPDAIYMDPWGNAFLHGFVVIGGGSGPYTPDGTLVTDQSLSQYALSVNGTIWSTEIKVCATYGGCDFVFDKDYNLMPLNDLEAYLKLNHHLPGIPSAKEMESNNGVELGKMNSQLLQKVEELTLYTIQLKKQLDEMQAQIDKLKESK